MTYRFKDNLLKASYSKEYELALQEWRHVSNEEREEIDRECICSRKVKNVHNMFNIKTAKIILIGSRCFEKFSMKKIKIPNNTLQNICKTFCEKGEYLCDFDIEEQLKIYMKQFIESFVNTTSKKLLELLDELKEIISDYKITDIKHIILKIEQEIERRDNERIKREERERRDIERRNKEELERLYCEEIERLDVERKNREEIEKNEKKNRKLEEKEKKINIILKTRNIDRQTYDDEQERIKQITKEKRENAKIQKINEAFYSKIRDNNHIRNTIW